MFDFLKKDKSQPAPEKKLWQQFQGKGNSDEILIEKAKAVSPFVVTLVIEDTKSLFQQLEKDKERKVDRDKFGAVFLEMALFYLHFVDRIAFQYLGAERRNIFIDALFVEIKEALSRIHESGIDAMQFRSTFGDAYNERQVEYGKYKKLFAEKDEGTKDTLFWEFGKKIAGIFGSEMDIIVIMYVTTIVYSLTALQLPELFKE